MRQRVAFEVIFAGTFKSTEKTYEQVAEFLGKLEPQQVISVSHTHDAKVVVWYRQR